jgi:hypothetical protein
MTIMERLKPTDIKTTLNHARHQRFLV